VWTRAVQNGRIEVAGAALPVDPAVSDGSEVAVVVRPKDVELQPASEREAHAQVVRSAFKGSYSACWIRTKDGEVWEVHVPSADRHRWSPGAWVHMNVTRWFIFPR